MTEPDQAQKLNEEVHPIRLDAPDLILQLLVKAAHDGKSQIGLTLNVNGSVVSGLLVGRDRWFWELAEWADSKAVDGGIIPRAIGSALSTEDQEDGGRDIPADQFGFLHLRDARIFGGPKPMPTNQGFFWRGRLSHVSGWAMGNLSVGD